MAGPLAGQMLADLGADVIKVERPGRGDDTREWAPPFVADPLAKPLDKSVYSWTCNRGKRSVAADIATPEGRRWWRARRRADVLIENYKVGTLARYGLDYATLRPQPAPRLLLDHRLRADRPVPRAPGYDTIVQGMGGLMSITGNPDGAPGGGPQQGRASRVADR